MYTYTYITLHCITLLHNTTLHYITLHYITLHFITLQYSALHYIHTYIYTYTRNKVSAEGTAIAPPIRP